MSRDGIEKAEGCDVAKDLASASVDTIDAILSSPGFEVSQLPRLLTRKELPHAMVLRIARNKKWLESYPVKLALLKHPHVPRESALPILKHIHLFDLLEISKTPGALPEIKRLAEDAILSRRDAIALGQRISLARRGTNRLSKALLIDADLKVCVAALSNTAIREQDVSAALLDIQCPSGLAEAVYSNNRWKASRMIVLALVRNQNLPLETAIQLLSTMDKQELSDVLGDERLSEPFRDIAFKAFQRLEDQATKPLNRESD